jgi:hypothetical protein
MTASWSWTSAASAPTPPNHPSAKEISCRISRWAARTLRRGPADGGRAGRPHPGADEAPGALLILGRVSNPVRFLGLLSLTCRRRCGE